MIHMTPIDTEYITLQQLLKYASIIQSGGQVKHYLGTHSVMVNGQQEIRRGRKLKPGDQVSISDQTWVIQAVDAQ